MKKTLFLLLFSFFAALPAASSVTSPLSLEIRPAKTTFRAREPVTGQVIITNPLPGKLSAVFDIIIYHNDRQKYTSTAATEDIFTGKNKFDFKDFGIPQFNTGPRAAGFWRIEIRQRNLSEKYTFFTVISVEYPQ